MPSVDNNAYSNDEHETGRAQSTPHRDSIDSTTNDHAWNIAKKDNGFEITRFEEAEPEEDEPTKTCAQVWHEYPKSVFFIFGNEFCERFSYYGMKAVLTLYLRNILNFSQSTTTVLYSAFAMLCYFSPILGSILADGYIGKFHTIMWVSLLYAAGNVILSVAAAVPEAVHPWLDFIGLITIGLGTGGIKPCVQPFGADQFVKGQERQQQQFFSIFYFLINAGSTISIIVTPIFRTTPCLNQRTCYPLAFGVPAALMVIAVIFFALGSFWYKKSPPRGNVFSKVAKTAVVAIKNKATFEVKRQHWLDHYMDSHNCNHDDECREAGTCQKATFVEDVKAVLRVLIVFVPLPIFWALYDQQGSTWVIQATQMNAEISSGVYFLPDQMGVLNAVLIMVLIPIFTLGVYPLVGKLVKITPLRKMCVGCFLAGVAYIVCMLIQINIRPTLPTLPASGSSIVNVSNYVQACPDIQFVVTDGKWYMNQTIAKNETGTFHVTSSNLTWSLQQGSTNCTWVDDHLDKVSNMIVPLNSVGYTLITDDITDLLFHTAETDKSQAGEAVFTMNVNYYADKVFSIEPDSSFSVAFCSPKKQDCDPDNEDIYTEFPISNRFSDYADVGVGSWNIFLRDNKTFIPTNLTYTSRPHSLGAIFTMTFLPDPIDQSKFAQITVQQAPGNTYSILWQVPQYFVISVAEVLFSITGYELAYSQAPHSMKSVVFALYLITDAIGNVIILIITSVADFGADMTWMFLVYACLMFFITAVFILISIRYKYKTYENEHTDGDEKKKRKD